MNKIQMESAEIEQEKQIPDQLKILDNDLNELDSAIAILRDKLSPVLRDDLISVNDSVNDTEEDQDLVPLAAQIRVFDRRLRIALSAVRYFSKACQL